jgi:hypothetical protein
MAMTPEGRVKAQVRKLLQELGIWYYQPVQNGMGRVGIPDFICCWRGNFIAIETKAPGKWKDLTANQRRVIDEIVANDGFALVVDDVDFLRESLNAIQIAEKLSGE